jgi:DNA-directed RNA polymerase specialized sigma24 family protein
MARKSISMRHVKDILRLKHHNQLSVREVAHSCGLPVSTVGDYLQRAQAAGLARLGRFDPSENYFYCASGW